MPVLNMALRAFQFGWSIGQAFASKAWAAAITQQVNNVQQAVNDIANTWIWQGVRSATIWNGAIHGNATRFRTDTLHAFGDIDSSLNRIVNVLIPNSVKSGTSKNWGGIRQLRSQLASLTTKAVNTQIEVKALHRWINGYVNKSIHNQNLWDKNFTRLYAAPLQTLKDWIAAPELLGLKLILHGNLTSDLVRQLVKPSSHLTLDRLERALLAHAPKLTTVIDRTAVAILDSGTYDPHK